MIFHAIHTITIDRFGLGFKFPSKVKRLPIPMPKKWVDRAFNKLVRQYNESTNKDAVDTVLDDKYHFTSLGIRIELLGVMFKGLELSWVVGADENMLKIFKDYFKRDFDENGLQLILKEIKKLKSKYNVLAKKFESKPVEDPKEFDFLLMVRNVARIIKYDNLGNEKLYMLPYFIDEASKSIKQTT